MSPLDPPSIWAPSAELDLAAAVERVESDAPGFGRTVEGHILTAANMASRMPAQGEQVPEFDDPDLRQFTVVEHRVIYEPTGDTVRILAVLREPTTLTEDPRTGLRRVEPSNAGDLERKQKSWYRPFNPKQLRENTTSGRLLRWEIEAGEKRSGMRQQYGDVSEDGCTVILDTLGGDGEVISTREVLHNWKNLANQTRYPIDCTARTEVTITTPAGTFDCTLYVVTGDASTAEQRAWFAKMLPGPPVQMEQWRDGERKTRMVLVEFRENGASDSVRIPLEVLPDKRAKISREDNGCEHLHLIDCTAGGPDLERFFAEFSQSADARRVSHIDFYVEADHTITGEPCDQRAIDVLAKHGPFPHVKHLSIDGEACVIYSPADDLSPLANAVPELQSLDVSWQGGSSSPVVGRDSGAGLAIGRAFELQKLERLILSDLDHENLLILSRCSFPRLQSLELGLRHGSKETRQDHEKALLKFLCSARFPQLRRLNLSCPRPDDEQRPWFTDAMLSILPGSPMLSGLARLDLDIEYQGNEFTEEQLRSLRARKQEFAHLEWFRIDGEAVIPNAS